MNDLLNSTDIYTPIAFAMTYLLHSTIWIIAIALLLKLPHLQQVAHKNFLWKMALVGGLATSCFACFTGQHLLQIPIQEEAKELLVTDTNVQSSSTNTLLTQTTNNCLNPSAASSEFAMYTTSPITIQKKNAWQWNTLYLFRVLLVIWLLVSLFIFIKFVIQHQVFFKKIAPRKTIADSYPLDLLETIQQKSSYKKNIILTQSSLLNSPILIRNHEICLPEKAIQNLDNAQLEGILAHEMAHIARGDYQWSCVLALFEILFFFQPLQRYAISEIKNTNELLCDAWAAKLTGNHLALAQCLLTVAEWVQEHRQQFVLVKGMSLKKSELSTRVHSLLKINSQQASSFSWFKQGLVFASLMVLALGILPGFSFQTILKNNTEKVRTKKDPTRMEPSPVLTTTVAPIEPKKKSCSIKKCTNLSRAEIVALHPKKQCSILLDAVKKNDAKRVQELVKFVNADCLYCRGTAPSAPINAAARNGNVEIAQTLLQAGAYLYSKAWTDEGAVIAAARNGNLAMMQLFDEYGAYFDLEVEGHGTPLINAIQNDKHQMVQYLLDNGANPLIEDEAGKNALDYAQKKGNRMLHLLAKFQPKSEAKQTDSLSYHFGLQFEEAFYYMYLV